MHLQYPDGGKQIRHIYDFHTNTFMNSKEGFVVTASLDKEIRTDPEFKKALEAARRRLNVPDPIGDQC